MSGRAELPPSPRLRRTGHLRLGRRGSRIPPWRGDKSRPYRRWVLGRRL